MCENRQDPERDEIESALAGLTPSPLAINRDRLMYQAGLNAARRARVRPWVWPAVAAGLAFVVAGETLALMNRPVREVVIVRTEPNPVPQVVDEIKPARIIARSEPTNRRALEVDPIDADEALRLRRRVARLGLDGLDERPRFLTQVDDGGADQFDVKQIPSPLRRYELDRILEPGGPS